MPKVVVLDLGWRIKTIWRTFKPPKAHPIYSRGYSGTARVEKLCSKETPEAQDSPTDLNHTS